jgi:3-methylcrotonyl-CoA carboxylase beta subunit
LDILKSNIKPDSPDFRSRVLAYTDEVNTLRKLVRQFTRGGNSAQVSRHTAKGKFAARQRIDLLLDTDSPFLELSPLASYDQYNNDFPGAGIVTGIGTIHGRQAVIVANDATVKGGTYVAETIKKHLRAQEIAGDNNLPCVYLVDSGGIFLPEQARVFPDRHDFGRIFYNQAVLSSRGIPQISVVMGSCTAGGAYVPAMSDENIIVRNQGTIFLGGPPLVKAATGEEVTAEDLGGAQVHAVISGVADHLADSDEHAISLCRNIFETLPMPQKQEIVRVKPEEPLYDPAELYGILPFTVKENPDPREIIARIVDGSRFHEFKAAYGPTLITGFAHLSGYPVGILANHGVLHSESALKGSHFIELCNFRKIPLLFLQHITGFMVGREAEHRGIAKDGAKMVYAVAAATVPKFTVITGGSYGAGNYAMSGRAYNPRLLFMCPRARISVMGAEQAASVLTAIKSKPPQAAGKPQAPSGTETGDPDILERYEQESQPWYSTSRLWDDGIIDPLDMRRIISLGIAMSLNARFPEPRPGIYRM